VSGHCKGDFERVPKTDGTAFAGSPTTLLDGPHDAFDTQSFDHHHRPRVLRNAWPFPALNDGGWSELPLEDNANRRYAKVAQVDNNSLNLVRKESVMKGNLKLIETLNSLLADELTAISQYMVHSGMSENWGYSKLHDHFEKRAIDEMKHAERLIGRILFLEGIPVVSRLLDMHIGPDVAKQLENDHLAEEGAINAYNAAIVVAGDVADFATRDMLEDILMDEDRHIDKIEELQDQIKHMTVPVFLSTQVE
jgi:bacterioferritin